MKLTYKDLLGQLIALTPEQLEMDVRVLIHDGPDDPEPYGDEFEVESLAEATETEDGYFEFGTPFLNIQQF